jgi:hypothetical protein
MPLTTVSYTATQSLAYPTIISLVDTSVGSDNTLTSRRIYASLADGTYLVLSGNNNQYTTWPIADNAISLNLLPRDSAVQILVQWMNGSTVVYSKSTLWDFDLATFLFAYQLTQTQTSSPGIVQDANYFSNKVQLMVNLSDSEIAVSLAGDIYGAQSSLDRAYFMVTNQNDLF